MRPSIVLSTAVAALLTLSACQQAPAPEPQAQAAPVPAPAPEPAKNSELRDAVQVPIDKAKGVEDDTQKAAEEQRKQMDAAGG